MIVIGGTANKVVRNLGTNVGGASFIRGIRFLQSGNFYGSNQMGATTPFELGDTTQVDWGGNVGF